MNWQVWCVIAYFTVGNVTGAYMTGTLAQEYSGWKFQVQVFSHACGWPLAWIFGIIKWFFDWWYNRR